MSCPTFEVGDTLGLAPCPCTLSFTFDTVAGALLVGTLISYALFGVATIQAYIYYGRFPKDSGRMKTLVAAVWCGEFAHTVCIAISLYNMIITNFGHPENLKVLPPSLLASAFIGSLVSFTVQMFFTFRIYALSKHLFIPLICAALSLFRLVPPNVIVLGFGTSQPVPIFLKQWGKLFDAIWAASAVNDLLIAGTLVYLLYQRRSNVLERTAAIVDKLIAWTIETGVVTSIASIIMMIVFITLPSTFIWMACFVVIPRLFSNSLFASLNSRAALRNEQPRLPSHSNPGVTTLPRPIHPVNLSIEMNKVTMTTYD
ncbi:hypothetical protein B0H13DRAFT_2399066 [Mycena leptocephala]|nr:hypothetical protein B0H13DRAFT_2399066 [Mycena leptocephala]